MTLLRDVLLLAGHTPRSQAYIQTLAAHALLPGHALVLGDAPPPAASEPASAERVGDVLLPDLGTVLSHSLVSAGVPCTLLASRDVNAAEVVEAVRELAPRLIIFSGYGGQLVQRPLLDLGIPLLHVHSGWLPDYRGSTTLYYSLLSEGRCAATALVLDAHIDTGPVVARKYYPAPPAGTDIDRRYDPAIRADLLLQVLRTYHRAGRLTLESLQQSDAGSTFYVIHPLLKHLALLSQPTGKQ
jgi:methionyl-tRNA formyltransferase